MPGDARSVASALQELLVERALMEHGADVRRSVDAMAMIADAARRGADQIRSGGEARLSLPHVPLPNGRFIDLSTTVRASDLEEGAWVPDEAEARDELELAPEASPRGPDPTPIEPQAPLAGLMRWAAILLVAAALVVEFFSRRG